MAIVGLLHLADYMLAYQNILLQWPVFLQTGKHGQEGGCSWPQAEKIDNYFPGSTEQPGFDGVHSPGWGKGTLLHSIRVGTAASLASNSS